MAAALPSGDIDIDTRGYASRAKRIQKIKKEDAATYEAAGYVRRPNADAIGDKLASGYDDAGVSKLTDTERKAFFDAFWAKKASRVSKTTTGRRPHDY